MPLLPPVLVILGGVCAALHVGKLAPALAALQQSLGLTLVEAGFLLSTVQVAGMTAAVLLGAWADGIGLKRSMVTGLLVLAVASAAGSFAHDAAVLLLLRAVEGFGFLLVVLPAPAFVRALVPPSRVSRILGLWGAYMPLGTALALLAGPTWIEAFGWRPWWWIMAAASLLMAALIAWQVPAAPRSAGAHGLGARIGTTLSSGGPWLVALTFACYSGQWLAVIGFLPSIYEQAGIAAHQRGLLTALAAAVNMIGNIAAGRWLQRGVAPVTLLRTGFVAMALGSVIAFAEIDGSGAAPWLRYVSVLAFSMLGGLVPATLFALSMKFAPGEGTIATTVGWMQQWSAFGQFAGPPIVAWVSLQAGGWQWTWAVTTISALAGLTLTQRIRGRLRA